MRVGAKGSSNLQGCSATLGLVSSFLLAVPLPLWSYNKYPNRGLVVALWQVLRAPEAAILLCVGWNGRGTPCSAQQHAFRKVRE